MIHGWALFIYSVLVYSGLCVRLNSANEELCHGCFHPKSPGKLGLCKHLLHKCWDCCHTQPGPSVGLGWCADTLSALRRSPALGVFCSGSACQCHHTAGTSVPHWPGRGDFILTSGSETDEVKPRCCCSHVGTHKCSIWPLWHGEREILPAPAEQVPVCPCCPRDCTASSKPAAARKLFWDTLHVLGFVFIPLLPKLPTNCSWKIESAFLEIGAWLIKDRDIY